MQPVAERLQDARDATIAVPLSARPLLVAALYALEPRSTIVVLAGEDAARHFARDLATYLGAAQVLRLPLRTDSPWSDAPRPTQQIGERARAIDALANEHPVIVVASARALMRCVPPTQVGLFAPLRFVAGKALTSGITYESLPRLLAAKGYERLEQACEPGSFSMRGDTIDIFGAGMTHPVRIELFGNEVEAIRRVIPATGQSIGTLEQVELYPARELALTPQTAQHAANVLALVGQEGARIKQGGASSASRPASSAADASRAANDARLLPPNAAFHLELIEQGQLFVEAERYLPYLYEQPVSPLAYLGERTLVTLIEPRSLFDDSLRYYEELTASMPVSLHALDGFFVAPAQLDFGTQQRLTLLSLVSSGAVIDASIEVKRADTNGSDERLAASARSLLAGGYLTLLTVPDRKARANIELMLTDEHLPFVEAGANGEVAQAHEPPALLQPSVVNITSLDLPTSLIIPAAKLGILTLASSSASSAARRGRKHVDPTSLTFPYKPGDYVVHAVHGIALFKEIVCQEVAGIKRDYLYLEYAKGDKLFTPVEQVDKITRYVGPESSAPRLTRLNTSDWSRATGKARKAAKQLAFDLVDLYARRSSVQGFAYDADNDLQYQMELQFPYDETPDQVAAIADVKADMESEKPMDRLICGDVGFGKTEVALRAAFKAVQSGKQVMFLCPTTILAQQHFTTACERFEPFGGTVEVLSRFRTSAQQKRILEDFASGKVDMLVGTHRLLSADVNPKDLGLIIIDEEQRFGVQHKEQLKNMREQVDVLTLSATPIPRTMQMAISGVRDMSLIETPPASRTPIKVHVGEWDEDVVSGACRRELERGGQVYYVSNRVKSIDDAVARVVAVAPEARIGVAHGKMSGAQLEAVMERFAANEIDVLVATTIIESGLDNPHSNTLIIEDSQRLGLAQLYQLKGRVGRSHAQAYAYFLFPSQSVLTEEAVERLTAIDELQGLGSGVKIALKDLEIRGAGSLMGAEQHGMLSAVGFDLFASMLQEAVLAARNEQPIAHANVKVELPVPFFLPEEYLPAADERVLYYRRLAAATSPADVQRIETALEHSYGALPTPALNLVARARAKALAAELGIESVTFQRGKFNLEPLTLSAEAKPYIEAHKGIYLVKSRKLLFAPQEGIPLPAALIELLEQLGQ
ncbi:MAG: transcription-repair coupling factor [Coriobacteriales bacterium]|nr:transcription-repair coupling factor [Coriobacteriales bacterium]